MWLMGGVLFVWCGAAAAALVLGGAAAIARRWKVALVRFATGLLGLVLGVAVMSTLGLAYATGAGLGQPLEPSQKARLLAEAISAQMNAAALGSVVGVVVGMMLARRARWTSPAG